MSHYFLFFFRGVILDGSGSNPNEVFKTDNVSHFISPPAYPGKS
jgi:hypothetical protein